MRINFIFIFFLLFFLNLNLLGQNHYIDSLIKKYPIKSNEYIAFVFLNYSSCIKRVIYPEKLINDVINKTSKKIIIIAMVYCRRPKEINRFNKAYNWQYEIEPDLFGAVRDSIGCSYNTDICIINSKGFIIAEISNKNNYKNNLEILLDAVIKDN